MIDSPSFADVRSFLQDQCERTIKYFSDKIANSSGVDLSYYRFKLSIAQTALSYVLEAKPRGNS